MRHGLLLLVCAGLVRLAFTDPSTGALKVKVLGLERSLRPYVLVDGLVGRPDEDGECFFDKVSPGSQTVEVQVFLEIDDTSAEAIIGKAETTVVAGEVREIEIKVELPDTTQRVPLSGTLVIPDEWGEPEVSLGIYLREPTWARDPVTDPRIQLEGKRWSAFDIVPNGIYTVQVDPFTYRAEIQTGPQGRRDVRIEIPPPASVVLQVLDDETRQPAELDRIWWGCVYPTRTETAVGKGRFEFRAPQGTIVIGQRQLLGPYYYEEFERTLDSPAERITVLVMHKAGVRLLLVDQGRTIGLWDTDEVRVVPIHGRDTSREPSPARTRVLSWIPRHPITGERDPSGPLWLGVTRPGRYQITFGKTHEAVAEWVQLQGRDPTVEFEPIPPHTVTVKRGEYVDLVIHLKRRPRTGTAPSSDR